MKTWEEKLNTSKPYKIKTAIHKFGDISPGEIMLIPDPIILKQYYRRAWFW